MPLINPSFVEATSHLTPGEHVGVIETSDLKTSRKTGNSYVSWRVKFSSGQFIDYITPFEGRGSGMFKHLVHSAGESNYNRGPFNTDILHGRQILCSVQEEPYNGNVYLKIKRVKPCLITNSPSGPELEGFKDILF